MLLACRPGRRRTDSLDAEGITLKEVAAAANVSRATAARALNSYGYVSDETALRAVEAAETRRAGAAQRTIASRRLNCPISAKDFGKSERRRRLRLRQLADARSRWQKICDQDPARYGRYITRP
ncbi:LacI family DNA-binding transcriptional regulator [Mesorhizobium sp. ISC25]|uniref:LacI family DNA-binding transcriptional regulator n=1 Tax=Mesorhizobium sp. ISC25 TaxID=3077335 RepID=UPI0035E01747